MNSASPIRQAATSVLTEVPAVWPVGATGTFSTQYPGQRVDYIFTHTILHSRFKDAWIEQDRLAKYASDHFPIGLELSA